MNNKKELEHLISNLIIISKDLIKKKTGIWLCVDPHQNPCKLQFDTYSLAKFICSTADAVNEKHVYSTFVRLGIGSYI